MRVSDGLYVFSTRTQNFKTARAETAFGHDSKPVPSTFYYHNVFLECQSKYFIISVLVFQLTMFCIRHCVSCAAHEVPQRVKREI
jgi:hypothetical protein